MFALSRAYMETHVLALGKNSERKRNSLSLLLRGKKRIKIRNGANKIKLNFDSKIERSFACVNLFFA
jgi:hypothetical protein